jgi:hypothetical protein
MGKRKTKLFFSKSVKKNILIDFQEFMEAVCIGPMP